MEIDLLEPKQLELGYRAFLKADRLEVWHGERFVCSIPVTASPWMIRATVWQDSFLIHLKVTHLKELVERG